MANLEATIAQFVAGDDLSIERTITSIPSGQYVENAWFTIKRSYDDSDNAAILQKIITSGAVNDVGQITSIDESTALLIFYLTPIDTIKLTPLSDYRYDIQIKLDNGVISTPESGIITAFPQITQAI